MRVQVHPADLGGCGYYRLRWPVEVLQSHGYDVEIKDSISALFTDDLITGEQRYHGVTELDADVVVFQRPSSDETIRMIPDIQALGVAVVVEVDDDFSCIPANNAAFKAFHPKSAHAAKHNWHNIAKACRMADLVTVSTRALAKRYGAHGRVVILPNYVPEHYFEINHVHNDPPTIGWTGTPMTHPGDLETTGGAIAEVVQRNRVSFTAIGSEGTLNILGIEGEVKPWIDLTAGYPELVSTLDIGIVPLVHSAFNNAKSWLKGLEYAALGVPFVATPTPEYSDLHRLGAGLLADRPREWNKWLRTLLVEPYRIEKSEQSRDAVRNLTYEHQAWRWEEAWYLARNNRLKAAA